MVRGMNYLWLLRGRVVPPWPLTRPSAACQQLSGPILGILAQPWHRQNLFSLPDWSMMDSCTDPGSKVGWLLHMSPHVPTSTPVYKKTVEGSKTTSNLKINEAKMQLRKLASFKNLYTRLFTDTLPLTFSMVHPSNFIYKSFHLEVTLDQRAICWRQHTDS